MEQVISKSDPYNLARQQIACWRGNCVDFYARGERVIGQSLLAIRAASKLPESIKLPHLAGQRVAIFQAQLVSIGLSEKALNAVGRALTEWFQLDEARTYLAHGVLDVTLDSHAKWFAIFDANVFRANEVKAQRWTISAGEAQQHLENLETAWKNLSAQLGQVRKAIAS